MALRKFETENARYYLGLGNHTTSSNNIFEDIDFLEIDLLVFEDTPGLCSLDEIESNHQYEELYSRAIRENPRVSIYGVDIISLSACTAFEGVLAALGLGFAYKSSKILLKEQKLMNRRDILKNIGIISGGTFLGSPVFSVANAVSGKYDVPGIAEYNNVKTNMFPTPPVGFRDAVIAKKISEYLVPKHRQDKDNKVNVALIYGALHSGIETKIKNPWISDKTIHFYNDLLGYMSKEDLNQVREVIKDNGSLKVVYHDCKLF